MNIFLSILWLFISILLQVLLFNQLHLFGGVVLIYLLCLLKLPVEIKQPIQILIGFVAGLLIDIFSNTLGIHALTCTFIMWLRVPIFHLFVLAEDFKSGSPNMNKMGISEFIRFSATITVIHVSLLYSIEAFSLFNIIPLVTKLLITSILTSLFIIAFEFALVKKK